MYNPLQPEGSIQLLLPLRLSMEIPMDWEQTRLGGRAPIPLVFVHVPMSVCD